VPLQLLRLGRRDLTRPRQQRNLQGRRASSTPSCSSRRSRRSVKKRLQQRLRLRAPGATGTLKLHAPRTGVTDRHPRRQLPIGSRRLSVRSLRCCRFQHPPLHLNLSSLSSLSSLCNRSSRSSRTPAHTNSNRCSSSHRLQWRASRNMVLATVEVCSNSTEVHRP